jgi:hypothetical protein
MGYLRMVIVELRNRKSTFPQFKPISGRFIIWSHLYRFMSDQFLNPIPMNQNSNENSISKTNFIILAVVYLLPVMATLLVQRFAAFPSEMASAMNTFSSVIQAPLMLIILIQLADNKRMNRIMGVTLAGLLTANSLTLALGGINEINLLKIMLVGSAPVFVFSSLLFIHYLKISLYENKNFQKTVILAGIVFAFGSYVMMLMMHLIDPMRHADDLRFVLGLISIISTAVIAGGLAYSNSEKRETARANHKISAFHAGFAQWENFTLSNTPEESKKGVTDISKYYSGLQKSS